MLYTDKSKSLMDFMTEHKALERVSFHMPGHKGKDFFEANGYGEQIENLVNGDITEIHGADNLFMPEGVLRNLMNRYKTIYGVKEAFLLVGGSSAGIIATILSLISKDETLIMASNCHKSVYNAVLLSGGRASFVTPEVISGFGIAGEVKAESVKRAMDANPHAKAVLITSPNYYGVCSDIKAIAETVHSQGKILIVDEAHGAHLKLMDCLGQNCSGIHLAAESAGADVVITSTHKTMASFTQTALALVCSDRVSADSIADKLQMIESSSPSYILMKSLEINAELMEKKSEQLIKSWSDDIEYVYGELKKIKGLDFFDYGLHDRTKLVMSFSRLGVSGYKLDELLRDRGIFVELADMKSVVAMSGIGNRRCDYEALISALSEISGKMLKSQDSKMTCNNDAADMFLSCVYEPGGNIAGISSKELYSHKEITDIPREVRRIALAESANKVSSRALIPYPPGIPVIVPGECISELKVKYLSELREKGVTVIGVDESGTIMCGD